MPIQLQPVSRQARTMRRPVHTFQLRTRPWQIQPFLIAPVLPGETMRNLLLQSRVVTDPIANPLIGWWCEYYIFYCRHRDLDNREHYLAMMLDPQYDLSGLYSAAKTEHYHFGTTIDWVGECLERVVSEYFRDEGEAVEDFLIGDLPAAQIMQTSWLDSTELHSEHHVPDVDLDLNEDGTITANEMQRALIQWYQLVQGGATEMTYEEFLRSYGVRGVPDEDPYRPELVRYLRDWTYPTNHVDPTTGDPSSACSWAIAERADKDRFFREPGFVFGVAVQRPKVYLGNQVGSAVGLLNSAYAWLPAVLRRDVEHSRVQVTEGDGPLPEVGEDYWVDLRDLFMYGDQFVNFPVAEATAAGMVDLPSENLNKRYPDGAMADALFAGAKKEIRQDGVVNLAIATAVSDTSPRTPSRPEPPT